MRYAAVAGALILCALAALTRTGATTDDKSGAFALVEVAKAQASPAPPLPRVSGPEELTIPAGRLAPVPVEVDADQYDYRVVGRDCDGFREYDPDPRRLRLRVIGYAAGEFWVVVAARKGDSLAILVVKVTVGGGPTPPAPPAPGPTPPTPPRDPLADSIREAAKATGWPSARLGDYGVGFRVCANLAKTWKKTAGELQAAVGAELRKALTDPAGKLSPVPGPVADVIDRELSALDLLLPKSNPGKVPTADECAAVAAVFDKIATALQGASK